MLKEFFKPLKPYLVSYKWLYVLGLSFLVLADAGQIIIPRLMGRSVDLIVNGSRNDIGKLTLAIVVLAVLVAVGRYGWRSYILGAARRIENDLRRSLYDKLLLLSGNFYGKHKVGDLMARATNDIRSIRMATGMALIAFVDGVFMSLVILTALFIGYGKLGFLIVIPLPLTTAMAIFFGRLLGPLFHRVQENFAKISEYVQETLAGGIRVLKSFAREEYALKTFSEINMNYGHANMSLARFWGVLFPAMGFIAGLTVLMLLFFGGQRIIHGQLSPGNFLAALAYLGMLLWPAMGAGWVVNMMQRGAASMRRIASVLNEVPDIDDLPGALNVLPSGSLEFRSLQFSYDERDAVLRDISFIMDKGTSIGILGRTGSGKTTLIRLISRILDPPAESVFIGGQDIRRFKLHNLRSVLGIVPQDVFLFSESIRDNIAFANPDATEEMINQAVDTAGLLADFPYFPDALETVVGERGVTLSGGQKQRIAIARALVSNPEILILDDALSAVDADTEDRILKKLFETRRNELTVMISHRVSALSYCDKCIVLEDGRVSASGIHEELVTGGGFYQEIAELQKLEDIEVASR